MTNDQHVSGGPRRAKTDTESSPRVLYATDFESLGGGEYALLRYAALAQSLGYHVAIAAPPGEVRNAAHRSAIPTIDVSSGAAAFSKDQFFDGFTPDVCHLLSYGSLTRRVMWRAYFRRIPVVVDIATFTFPGGVRSRLFARAASMMLASSDAVARSVQETLRCRDAPVVLRRIPPAEEIPVPGRQPFSNAGNGALTIGWIGRFDPVKRLEDAIEAFGLVHAKYPESRFSVAASPVSFHRVGASEYEGRIRSLIERAGLTRAATIAQHDDIWSFLDQIDIFLLTSESETFSHATFEAMAMGRPVVATRAGAVPELVRPEHTGVLVEVGDVTGMAASVLRLAGDPEGARALGTSARQHALKLAECEGPSNHLPAIYHKLGVG